MMGSTTTWRERFIFRTTVLLILAIVMVAAFLFCMRFGSLKLSIPEIIQALFDSSPCTERQIIYGIRLPRALTAALVGACLALSGAILQGVMRNPLAAPNLIGVSAGGGLAAVIIMILLPQFYNLLVPAAFTGSLTASFLIYLLAWKQGIQPTRLILAGVAVASLLGAGINTLLVLYPDRVAGVLDFMVGSVSARSWRHVHAIWPYALVGTVTALFMAGKLNILVLGETTAASLGLKVELTRMILIATAALLAASAVSVAGLLGFVGLLVPHILRMIIGSDHRFLFPACVMGGAGLLMACDTAGRIIRDPVELPVGIIMALLGAPFFLYLLRGRLKHEN